APQPVDVTLRTDAADLVESATGPERKPNEPLKSRMERFQQQCLSVEREDARPRLVLATLDAAEGIPDIVSLVDRAPEDRLQQSTLTATGALRHEPALLVSRIARHLHPSQIQVADDVGLRDLVEPLRTEVSQEVRDDLRVTVPGRLQGRVRLAVDGPPFREARDRALPSVNPGANVVLDLRRAPFRGLLVREPGGLAEQLTVDRFPEVPDPSSLPQSHCAPPCSSSDQEPVGRIE